MAMCIKTGAYLLLKEYGAYVPADLYAVGDCLLAKFDPKGLSFTNLRPTTHEVMIDRPASYGFYDQRLGILVAPAHHFKELANAPSS